jgi:MinD superfamily P-loop ATPase
MSYIIITNKCTDCGVCSEVCMNGAITQLSGIHIINPVWCNDCGACEAMCFENAIALEGFQIDTSPIDEEYKETIWQSEEQFNEELVLF